MIHSRAIFIIFSLLTLGGIHNHAQAFSGKKPDSSLSSISPLPVGDRRTPDPKTEEWLTTLNREEMLGISNEDEESQDELRDMAKKFASVARQRDSKREQEIEDHCSDNQDSFCKVMEDSTIFVRRKRNGKKHQNRLDVRTAKAALLKGNIDKLDDIAGKDIARALKSISSFDELAVTSKKILDLGATPAGCQYSVLSFLVGIKAEEGLPDEAYRKAAIDHYLLTIKCGYGEDFATASYRYSMLQIWGGHCEDAFPVLGDLANAGIPNDKEHEQPHELRARALYWRAQCGEKLGSSFKDQTDLAKKQLIASFPFSLHALLLTRKEEDRIKSMVGVPDSIVRFRSKLKPNINDAVKVAESLYLVGEKGWAAKVLGSISGDAESAEPEFQLYLAWLLDKVGDPINKFKTLTIAFREHPEIVSRAALRLYYPKRELQEDVIEKLGVSPYVVMALIRQESAFNEQAKSSAGALGLMQLMLHTARLYDHNVHKASLMDPNKNVSIGVRYFANLLKRYNGDTELALASYNAGPQRTDQWLGRYTVEQRLLFLDLIPFRETRDYVASIARNFFWYSTLYMDGADPKDSAAMASIFKVLGS